MTDEAPPVRSLAEERADAARRRAERAEDALRRPRTPVRTGYEFDDFYVGKSDPR